MAARTKRTGFLFFRGLDRDLKDLFKSYCARRGVSMTRQFEKMIEALTKSDRQREGKRRPETVTDVSSFMDN